MIKSLDSFGYESRVVKSIKIFICTSFSEKVLKFKVKLDTILEKGLSTTD